MNTVLAIDPSLSNTGVVVIRNGELLAKATIETKPTKTATEEMKRLNFIIDRIFDLVAKYHDKGMVAALEGLSFGSKYGHTEVRAGLNYLIRDRFMDWKIPLIIVPPLSLKKFTSGKGNSQKEDMKLAVWKRWKFEDASNDICDAFALNKFAECYVTKIGTKSDLEAVAKAEMITAE